MKLIPTKPVIMIKVLQKAGFSVKRQTGSHVILFKEGFSRPISVPMHVRELPTGTQRAILRQAEISLDQYNKLLKG